MVKDLLKNEKEMYLFLKYYCESQKYTNSLKALPYAYSCHQQQFRKGSGLPYITHPMSVAIIDIMHGFHMDELIALDLLHDVPEDCNTDLSDLDVLQCIKYRAQLLNWKRYKHTYPNREEAMRLYYEGIQTDLLTSITKMTDRFHNLSTMIGAFSDEKKLDYSKETQTYYPSLIETASSIAQVEKADWQRPIWVLNNEIWTLVETYEDMIKSSARKKNIA